MKTKKDNSQNYDRENFLDALQKELSDPFHKRLIQSYRGEDPLLSMESELGEILLEVLQSEN